MGCTHPTLLSIKNRKVKMMKNILNPGNPSGAMLSGGGRNPKD